MNDELGPHLLARSRDARGCRPSCCVLARHIAAIAGVSSRGLLRVNARYRVYAGTPPRLLRNEPLCSPPTAGPMPRRCCLSEWSGCAQDVVYRALPQLLRWPHQRRETRDAGKVIRVEGDQGCLMHQSLGCDHPVEDHLLPPRVASACDDGPIGLRRKIIERQRLE